MRKGKKENLGKARVGGLGKSKQEVKGLQKCVAQWYLTKFIIRIMDR